MDYFIAIDGDPNNDGTIEKPWDIASGLQRRGVVNGGDTLYIRGGLYRHPDRGQTHYGWPISLMGTAEADVVVRPYGQERVTIDGGLATEMHDQRRPGYLMVRDLEITVLENMTLDRRATDDQSHPPRYSKPIGGFNAFHGNDLKIVNCVVHDNQAGSINLWKGTSGECEVYGCIVYNNGWLGTARGHTHGTYCQNPKPNAKLIANNIFQGNFAYCMQAYGSTSVRTDNFTVEENICSGKMWNGANAGDYRTLVGGQATDSNENLTIQRNALYWSNLQIGWNVGGSNLLCKDNTIVLGRLHWGTDGQGGGFDGAVVEDNFVWQSKQDGTGYWHYPNPAGPDSGHPVPTEPLVHCFQNKYESGRAHIAIISFHQERSAELNVAGFLPDGTAYVLKDPMHFYGPVLQRGVVADGKITVPIVDNGGVGQSARSIPTDDPDMTADANPLISQLTTYVLQTDDNQAPNVVPVPPGSTQVRLDFQ